MADEARHTFGGMAVLRLSKRFTARRQCGILAGWPPPALIDARRPRQGRANGARMAGPDCRGKRLVGADGGVAQAFGATATDPDAAINSPAASAPYRRLPAISAP